MRHHLLLLLANLLLICFGSLDESAIFVRVHSPADLAYTYEIIPAQFGPAPDAYRHTHRNVQLKAASLEESCRGIHDDLTGHVVIMPRGECSFLEKVKNAELANARFALITEVNSSSSATISMSRGGIETKIRIPSAYIAGSSGSRLYRAAFMRGEDIVADLPINGTDVSMLLDKAPWEIW